jgi:hypothetical protein
MRFYRIVITPQAPASGTTGASGAALGGLTGPLIFTSQANGKNDPGALDIEFDIPVTSYALPMGGAGLKIWGIPLQTISQATNLNNANIEVYAGMAPGLPLATALAPTAGLIAQGSVLPAFGNWIGNEMSLDLILWPPLGTPKNPKNIVINWQKGMKLSDAIASMLGTAFPGFTSNINISPNLVLSQDSPAFYESMEQFARWVRQASQSIMGSKDYQGVKIAVKGKTINVFDGTGGAAGGTTSAKQIKFQDLIGQPTWLGLNTIQFKCPIRADIGVGDMIKLPPTQTISTEASSRVPRSNSVFQGGFEIQRIRYVGHFRQKDAYSWNSTFDAVTPNTGT